MWDESWVRDATLDERQKSRHTTRFDLYSIAEEWERLRQLDRQVDNANCLYCHLCCNLCSSTGTMGIIIPNNIGCGIPLIGIPLISLLDSLL